MNLKLTKTGDNMPNIRHELLIGASSAIVFDAITTQKGLSGWWTPDVHAKPEAGSTARFAFGPDYFKEMQIVELAARQRVRWQCLAGESEWIGTSISFELRAGEIGTLLNARPEIEDQVHQHDRSSECTLLVMSHDGWTEHTPMFAECSYTWAQFLRSLRLLCETGRGLPFPHQHSLAM